MKAGVGVRLPQASAAPTIMTREVVGNSARASTVPTMGTMLTSDIPAMHRKNRAASATGWRREGNTHPQLDPFQAGARFDDLQLHAALYSRQKGCAMRWRSTCSKWRGSWGVSRDASRGR